MVIRVEGDTLPGTFDVESLRRNPQDEIGILPADRGGPSRNGGGPTTVGLLELQPLDGTPGCRDVERIPLSPGAAWNSGRDQEYSQEYAYPNRRASFMSNQLIQTS